MIADIVTGLGLALLGFGDLVLCLVIARSNARLAERIAVRRKASS